MDEEHILSDKEWLLAMASLLQGAGGEGGTVYLSPEFVQMIAHRLRAIADKMGTEPAKEWIRTQPEVKYDLGPGPGQEETDEPHSKM